MAQDVVSLLFSGDSQVLLPRYEAGLKTYRGPSPESVTVAHGEQGLMVTLVWGEGVDHEGLGAHMRASMESLGLPFPQATHGVLVSTSWTELVNA